MTCQFCGESEIADLCSYKGHLLNDCEEFEEVETPLQERMRKIKA